MKIKTVWKLGYKCNECNNLSLPKSGYVCLECGCRDLTSVSMKVIEYEPPWYLFWMDTHTVIEGTYREDYFDSFYGTPKPF